MIQDQRDKRYGVGDPYSLWVDGTGPKMLRDTVQEWYDLCSDDSFFSNQMNRIRNLETRIRHLQEVKK